MESVAVRKDKGRKVEEVKEVKKTVREVKQTRERERQQAKKVPQPARRSPVPHPEQTLLQAFRLLSTDDWWEDSLSYTHYIHSNDVGFNQ